METAWRVGLARTQGKVGTDDNFVIAARGPQTRVVVRVYTHATHLTVAYILTWRRKAPRVVKGKAL